MTQQSPEYKYIYRVMKTDATFRMAGYIPQALRRNEGRDRYNITKNGVPFMVKDSRPKAERGQSKVSRLKNVLEIPAVTRTTRMHDRSPTVN